MLGRVVKDISDQGEFRNVMQIANAHKIEHELLASFASSIYFDVRYILVDEQLMLLVGELTERSEDAWQKNT